MPPTTLKEAVEEELTEEARLRLIALGIEVDQGKEESDGIPLISSVFNHAWDALKGVFGVGNDVLSSFSGVFTDINRQLLNILPWDSIKGLIQDAWDMARLDDILDRFQIKGLIEDTWSLTTKLADIGFDLVSQATRLDDLARELVDLVDPVSWATRTVKALAEIAEDLAEDLAHLGYRVLNRIWDAKIWK